MTHPWPEEESLTSQLGDVFDEALTPHKTGQEVVDELLEAAALMRAAGRPVPGVIENLERMAAIEVFLHGQTPCAWLRDQRARRVGGIEQIVEHWRGCATCQTEARREREARQRPEPEGG